MKFIPESNLLVTGSWDRTVRIWDLRSPTAAATLNVGERVYAMDAKQQAIVSISIPGMV
jgi:mRNA export factor